MAEPWTVERVEAAAPDQAAAAAGRKLASPKPWSGTGCQGDLLWGACQGSGRTPYRVSIDTAAVAYKCSCPSRKFPCKHALGLLFLWAEGHVSESGEIADFAAQWARSREERATKRSAPKQKTTEQQAAAAKRAARREDRVSGGLEELDRFLSDQFHEGLAAHASDRMQRLERMASRMVDAQAPEVANRLRELATVPNRGNWPTRVVDEYGLLHLLAKAWAGREQLPPDLVATVRSHIGFPVRSEDVLATPGVRDRWVVLGMYDIHEQRITVRRVWLWGRDTGTRGLVLFFAHGNEGFDTGLLPGSQIDANLHFYPGRPQLRAAIGEVFTRQETVTDWNFRGTDVSGAIAEFREAVTADPWAENWPVAIHGRLNCQQEGTWLLADTAVPLIGHPTAHWQLLAEMGSEQRTVFGVLTGEGLRPIVLLDRGEVRPL